MNLVTVLSTFNAAEAQLARARLEAANFHVVLTNEIAALMGEGPDRGLDMLSPIGIGKRFPFRPMGRHIQIA